MDPSQLRDEAVRDRVRAAQEFLDPRMPLLPLSETPRSVLIAHSQSRSSTKLSIRHHSHATEVPATARS